MRRHRLPIRGPVSIPRTAIGTSVPPTSLTVERGQLMLFAKAIGETNPVYLDVEAARAADHPDVLVPPTFLFALDLAAPDQFGWLTSLGVDMADVLHGSQSFTYHQLVHAGDTLTATSTITDTYSKKNGALEFVVRHGCVTRGGDLVAELEQTVVIQHKESAT
jgi:acyl dehydratase